MPSSNIIPVILCGGSGTRLWPLSRRSYPKQFLKLAGDSKKSLLQLTASRVKKIDSTKDPIIICNEEHRFIVAEQMREIQINPKAILLEPFGKNTAPAITLSALKALDSEEDPLLLILSSDHFIELENDFVKAVEASISYAQKNRLITFGIVPKSPETGYGYIKSKEPLSESLLKGSSIESFIEKPDLKTAKELIKDKRYTWNSGIFLFKANLIIEEIKKYSPNIYSICRESLVEDLYDLDFQRINKVAFSKSPNISIDYAVMEKTTIGTVMPLSANWTDIGSWDAVWKIAKKNTNGNVIDGNIISKDTKNCYLKSDKRLIATLGVEDLIVVDTSDAVLIANMKNSQEVKNLVNLLKERKIPEWQEHKKIFRPWGFYESIAKEKNWQVKLITVNPCEQLSMQKHNHRSEHWVIVSGTAQVDIDEKKIILFKNQSTYIPLGSKHRLSNHGTDPLLVIEIQSGSYLGEDDIERFEDKYGR